MPFSQIFNAKRAKKERELEYFPKKSTEHHNQVINSDWSGKGLLSFTDPASILVR